VKDVSSLGFANEMKSSKRELEVIECEDEEVKAFQQSANVMLDRMDNILIIVRGVNEIKEPQRRLEVRSVFYFLYIFVIFCFIFRN
jgi:hypothetical protein